MDAERTGFQLARQRRNNLILQYVNIALAFLRTLNSVAYHKRRIGDDEGSNRLKIEAACACLRLQEFLLHREKDLPSGAVRKMLVIIERRWRSIAAV